MARRRLEVEYVADTDNFDRGNKRARESLKGVGDTSQKQSRRLTGATVAMGTAIGTFAGGAARELAGRALGAITDFVGGSIQAASDLGETLNKSDAIFEGQAKVMRDWAKTASTSFGLSTEEALAFASQLGDMGRQLGLSSKDAANFSQDIVGMAADLGSFNNLETSDVLDRINAAMRGEYDSLQALIPNINAARVEQEALAATGKESAKQLTAQEKALAVQAILHKDGARAMGDFAKTSDGFANQQKIVAAQLKDVQAQLGKALLPVLQGLMAFVISTVIPGISEFVDWFQQGLGPAIGDVIGQFKSFLPVVQQVAGFIAQNADWLVPLAAGIGAVVIAVKAWTVAQRVLNTVMRANPIGIVITVLGLLVSAFIYAYQNSETFRNVVNTAFTAVKNVVVTVGNAVIGAVKGIIEWFTNTWKAAVDFGVRVYRAFNKVNSDIQRTVSDLVRRVTGFFQDMVRRGADLVLGFHRRVTDIVRNIRNGVINLFNNLRDGVVNTLRRLRDGAIDLATSIRDWVVNRFQSLVNRGVQLVWNLRDGFFRGLRSLRDGAINLATSIRDWVVNRIDSLRNRVSDIAWSVRDRVIRAFRSLRDVGRDIFRGLRDSVGKIFGSLLDKVKGPLRTVFRWLNRNLIGPLDSVTSKFGLNIPDLPRFHKGGIVGGQGEQPAVLLSGEGVLPRSVMRMLGKDGFKALQRGEGIGGPGDWLKNFTEFISSPAKLVAEMAKNGIKWAVNQVMGAIPSIPETGVPLIDAIPNVLNNIKSNIRNWATETQQEQATALAPSGSIGSGPWVKPVAAGIGNGYLGYPGHYGVDMPVGTGTPVHAVSNGVVTKAASLTYSYGKHLFLRHADGLVTVYAHLSRLLAHAGQSVNTGQVIGASGSTGNSSGPHLHFETRVGGGYPGPNPRSVMAARGVTLDSGGMLQPGLTLVRNATGGPEPVLTQDQWAAMRRGGSQAPVVINVTTIDPQAAGKYIEDVLKRRGYTTNGVRINRRAA